MTMYSFDYGVNTNFPTQLNANFLSTSIKLLTNSIGSSSTSSSAETTLFTKNLSASDFINGLMIGVYGRCAGDYSSAGNYSISYLKVKIDGTTVREYSTENTASNIPLSYNDVDVLIFRNSTTLSIASSHSITITGQRVNAGTGGSAAATLYECSIFGW